MQMTAGQIAALIGGRVEGNAEATVSSFAKIEEAGKGDLSFVSNPKFEDYLYSSQATVIIIQDEQELKNKVAATLVRVADPYRAFMVLLQKYQEMKAASLKGIEQPSFIAPSAVIGADVYIGAFSYISENASVGNNSKIYPNCFIGANVKIGNDCVLHPGVKIYHDCVLGNGVVIHAGTVIGADGFGYQPTPEGKLQKVPQTGNVVIEDDVEIGANSAVDRATMGSTTLKAGVKLDNLVQVGHNVQIGESTVVAGQTGIAGSARIGRGVMVGGQVGILEHLNVADGVKIAAQAKITKNVRKNMIMSDSPAFDYHRSLKSQVLYRNLPELEERIRALEEASRKKS